MKKNQKAPSAPTIVDTTKNSVQIQTQAGLEYSIDGRKTWTTKNTFTKLQANKTYKVVARRAETKTYKASPASKAANAKTKQAPDTAGLQLNRSFKATQSKGQINVKWGKVTGATKYEIYVQYCGKESYSKTPTKTVKASAAANIAIKKLNGSAVKAGKSVKVKVIAKKGSTVLATTVGAHVAGSTSKKLTNVKSLTLKKTAFSLKKGKTAQIKAGAVLQNKKLKLIDHTSKFRYASYDKGVAKVDKNGKITAVGKGTCTILVFVPNGNPKKVTVTVQ